jgi:cysteinyl-tRNA synthetase
VDDKIIRDAKKAGMTIAEFTKNYEKYFFEDLKKLNIEKAEVYPKATKHIKEMVFLISRLLKKKLAYSVGGSVYFDISKFKPYGRRLAKIDLKKLKAGARIDADEYGKEAAGDFALWKAAKIGEPSWQTPFGAGRPGWHIECSAMSVKYLGQPFDIHTGGVDLLFPHHEDEIAQSEGASGKKFARVFLEGEHLLVDGKKMSKSLGNFYTIRDAEKRGFNPLAFRYLVLTTHYRSKLNFTWDSLRASQNSLNRLLDFARELSFKKKIGGSPVAEKLKNSLEKYKKKFSDAVFDDLETPKAVAVVWDLVRDYNKNSGDFNPKDVLDLLYDFDKVLGLGLKTVSSKNAPESILKLVEERERLRAEKNWARADQIREKIQKSGFLIEDTPAGPIVKPK